MRNTMIMNLGEDYIRLAKAKGLPDRVVALKYAARNAMLPSVTGFALALGGVLGGAILVETVFDYPGLGRLMGEAVGNKDYPLLQTLMLLTTVGRARRQPRRRPALRSARPTSEEGRSDDHHAHPDRPDGRGQTRPVGRASSRSATSERPDHWWQVIWSSKKARVGVVIVAVYVLVAIFAPLIAPHDPLDSALRAARRRERRQLARHDDRRPRHRLPAHLRHAGSLCWSGSSAVCSPRRSRSSSG